MALNPEIALGYRPPQVNLDVPSPIQQFGQLLTLRGLMEQQQLRGLQTQQAQEELLQFRQAAESEKSLRDLLTRNPNAGAAEVIGAGGTVRGAAWLKSQADAEKARLDRITQANTINVSNAKRRAQIAAGVTDLEGAKKAAWQAANEGVYDLDPAKNIQIAKGVLEHLQKNGFNAEEWKQHAQESMDYAARLELADKQAEEERKKAKAPFELSEAKAKATTAEQTAAGTKPIQPEEQARLAAEKVRLDREAAAAKETERHNRAMEARAAQATAAGLTQGQSQRVLQIAGQFDNEPMVKNYNVIGEANNFVKTLGEKGKANSTDDQALLYAFAKAMDPGSVVREGEYATVQKYAQSWADNFGFKAERIFSNSPFLSDVARKQMKATIEKRAASAKQSYDNIYNEYGRRIERQSGVQSGKDYLTNYGQAFEGGAAPAAVAQPTAAAPQTAAPKKAAPAVGTVKDGYRFLGGDPADPKNWRLALTVK